MVNRNVGCFHTIYLLSDGRPAEIHQSHMLLTYADSEGYTT